MSSTNRGNNRHASDYYVTPIQPIVDFFKAAQEDLGDLFVPTLPLDPCAGGDPKHDMSYPVAIHKVWPQLNTTTIDIRPDSRATFIGDYLQHKLTTPHDFICSNPPFVLALEFIEKALAESSAWVAMLLRLNFFGTEKRQSFWQKHMPAMTYVHARRMSFTEDGKTDSIEYMHCLWCVEYFPKFTQLRTI